MSDSQLTELEIWIANRGAAIQRLYNSGLSKEDIELILDSEPPS